MGFFKEIFVKETETGKLVNIIDLDKERYESFLECTTKVKAAYIAALERRGDAPVMFSNRNILLVNLRSELLAFKQFISKTPLTELELYSDEEFTDLYIRNNLKPIQ